MQLQSPLFRIPRELRDQIYGHYLICETGLEYDFSKNKLTRMDGEDIDLSLTYTCREAAAELHGLALRLNKITFRTACPGSSRFNRGKFDVGMRILNSKKEHLLDEIAQSCLTDEMEKKITLVYPQFAPIVRKWRLGGRIGQTLRGDFTFREPPSVYRDFVHFTLKILENSPHFSMPSHLLSLPHLKPWQYPDDEALEEILSITFAREARPNVHNISWPVYWDGRGVIVSAAACAIQFLSSLPRSIRSELRRIDLIEDRKSVSYPECHARGLIPFCQENEKLRIHSRVDVWWNLLWEHHWGKVKVHSRDISRTLAKWMGETMALPLLGMPSEAFMMTFECDSAPEKATEVFDVLQRDAAWQVALDLSYERQHLPTPSWDDRRRTTGHISDDFPQILKNIVNNDSFIRCDFFPGDPHDPELIVNQHMGKSLDEWEELWRFHTPLKISMPSNRPSWCPAR